MNETSKTTPNSGHSIVYFGTGPVAAESLRLIAKDFEIEAVVTKPKPAHHKGSFPVEDVASELGIPVVEVSNADEVSKKVLAAQFASQVAVLIDFGIIVRQDVIDVFSLGIINSHFSLLPQWRGADPITFSILSGQKQTGVSLMKVVEKLDEGDVIAFGLVNLDGTETNQSLTRSLIHLSAALLRDNLPRYVAGGQALPQEEIAAVVPGVDYPRVASYSHKLSKQDGILDLSKPAAQLEREVRAYLGWPGSRISIAGKDVVIIAAHVADNTLENVDKKAIFVANKQLCLQTADGILVIDSLKPAGKPVMSAAAFINGHRTLL